MAAFDQHSQANVPLVRKADSVRQTSKNIINNSFFANQNLPSDVILDML